MAKKPVVAPERPIRSDGFLLFFVISTKNSKKVHLDALDAGATLGRRQGDAKGTKGRRWGDAGATPSRRKNVEMASLFDNLDGFFAFFDTKMSKKRKIVEKRQFLGPLGVPKGKFLALSPPRVLIFRKFSKIFENFTIFRTPRGS